MKLSKKEDLYGIVSADGKVRVAHVYKNPQGAIDELIHLQILNTTADPHLQFTTVHTMDEIQEMKESLESQITKG